MHPPLLTYMHQMPSPSHSSRFYHPHNIGWRVFTTTFINISKLALKHNVEMTQKA
jgi:hypothetical protein